MKRKWKSFAALLLVCALVAATPALDVARAADLVDLDRDCSLTVHPGGLEFEDLSAADIVVDLYQVAVADPVEGYDTYSLRTVSPYDGITVDGEMNSEAWDAVAQQAAKVALDADEPQAPDVAEAPLDVPVEGLDAGLYLVIAHEKDADEYVTTISDELGERIVSYVNTGYYAYTFKPVLVAVPGKGADEDDVINTANPGEWLYDVEVRLKPEQGLLYSGLEIVKNLEGYVDGKPATFVFQIEAFLGDERVYSDVVTLSFSEPGQRTVLIDKIPVGATVTVTEVYEGVVYELVTDKEQTAVIEANEIASVSFTNRPTDSNKNGGSITNSFEYSESGWAWMPIPDVP